MSDRVVGAIVAAVIACLIAVGIAIESRNSKVSSWGALRLSAGLEFRSIHGETVPLVPAAGSVTLINFWATWCAPCRAEIPDLEALHVSLRALMRVVGISIDTGSSEPLLRFSKELKVSYPIVQLPPDDVNFLEVDVVPTSILVNEDGGVIAAYIGQIDPSTVRRDVIRAVESVAKRLKQ